MWGRKKTDFIKCSSCKFHNFCSICLGEVHTESNSLHAINVQVCNLRRHCTILFDLEDIRHNQTPKGSNTFFPAQNLIIRCGKGFSFPKQNQKCVVYGLSMEPFLSFGETVVIVQCAWPLKKGHCYAFISGKTLTIHRFIKFSITTMPFSPGTTTFSATVYQYLIL